METRQQRYDELQRLLRQIEKKGYGALSDDDTLKLHSLYRGLLGDLARARRDYPGSLREKEINHLAAMVRGAILKGRKVRLGALASFFARELPLSIRRHIHYILICVLFFLTGSVFAYFFISLNPDKAHYILDPMLIENAERGFESGSMEKTGRMWDAKPLFVTFYVTNNTRVAFMAFALGIFFALPTIFILFTNGIAMGGTLAIVHGKGLTQNLLGFISPHGGIELMAIFFGAAAGMILGVTLLNPGRLPRIAALKKRAYDVIALVVAAALMLVIAALLESLVSPLPIDNRIKYTLGGINMTFVLLYMVSGFFIRDGNSKQRWK